MKMATITTRVKKHKRKGKFVKGHARKVKVRKKTITPRLRTFVLTEDMR